MASMARQVEAMLAYQADGAITFEYGNYIRGHAQEAGVANAYDIQGFVPLFVRPGFCRGRGPFRWVCLSGDACGSRGHRRGGAAPAPRRRAAAHVDDDGRDARADPGTCPRARAGWRSASATGSASCSTTMVKSGELKGPIAMSRDHLDTGSVAQPSRETEGMLDGSDAVADWPLLNALLNTANGADLVTIHQGAGSGMGGSISAGMTVIADGSESAAQRISRALFVDPAIGVIRHADAGYDLAIETKNSGRTRRSDASVRRRSAPARRMDNRVKSPKVTSNVSGSSILRQSRRVEMMRKFAAAGLVVLLALSSGARCLCPGHAEEHHGARQLHVPRPPLAVLRRRSTRATSSRPDSRSTSSRRRAAAS